MTIYRGVNGVNREIKQQFRGIGGVNREIKEQYRGAGGINRQVFKKGIGGIDANTLLMLHCDDYTDSSKFKRVSKVSSGYPKITEGKINNCLSGTSGNSFYFDGLANINGDFTLETWVKVNVHDTNVPSSDVNQVIVSTGVPGVISSIEICANKFYKNGMIVEFVMNDGNIAAHTVKMQGDTSSLDWQHIAIVRNSGNIKVYHNGVVQNIQGVGESYYDDRELAASTLMLFNTIWNSQKKYNGNYSVDELRLSNIARYTGNFTPPIEPYS